MAWTSPRTWVASEVVTAAIMNTHVRDNLKAIGDAWTSFTPTWTGVTTNPAIGNGTLNGQHMVVGKFVTSTMSVSPSQWPRESPKYWRMVDESCGRPSSGITRAS